MTTKTVTQNEVVAAMESFLLQSGKATGRGGQRKLFRDYEMNPGIRARFDKGSDLFVDGALESAMKEISEASKWLENAQRAYCERSLEVFFDVIIARMRPVDEDIMARITKLRRIFAEITKLIRLSFDTSLDDASSAYWALLDAINAAPVEQVARERNRVDVAAKEEKAKLVARRRLQMERDAESRRIQAESDARMRRERAEVARTMSGQLAAILG